MSIWRRFDTLFVRLFLLMWLTLVASQLAAWWITVRAMPPPPAGAPGAAGRTGAMPPVPVLPSLPPGGPLEALKPDNRPTPGDAPGRGGPPNSPTSNSPPHLPPSALWGDYALRALVIALGAALGARWISAPMRRLADSSRALSEGLAHRRAPAVLDEQRGTHEVREAARVFNQMATRLKQQFDARGLHMAAVSHDLRTPLTRLRMRLESAPPELAHAAAADIREMDETIDHSLAVLREQRAGDTAPVLDVAALLQALADDWAERGQAVPLALPLPSSLPSSNTPARARVHPAALRRIVVNLIDNARRHGSGARLGLRVGRDGLMITVDDDGPGIPSEQMARAFQPWVRLGHDLDAASDGQGLGLAIARDLAEHEGGTLVLANRPEGGLRATLTLPAA